jgi:hypothetical protein
MADATGAISLYAIRMRVARLNAAGAPLAGADNLYVTDKMVRVDYEPTYTTIDAVTKPNGRGTLCLNIPERQVISGANLTVELCEDDPELYEMLGGGSVLTAGAGTDVVGYQAPKSTDPAAGSLSIEVWTEAWAGSSQDSVLPYVWTAFPSCKLRQTARSLSASLDEKSFEGAAIENNGWGDGPAAPLWTHDSGAAWQWIRSATAPPAVTNGYAVIATQT